MEEVDDDRYIYLLLLCSHKNRAILPPLSMGGGTVRCLALRYCRSACLFMDSSEAKKEKQYMVYSILQN